jgi:aspartyl-tRNA(Asn)/glutamyl-tRNA(Gln) amidotransferase subunit A
VEPGFGPVDPEVAAEVAAAAGLFKDAVRLVEAVCISALEQNNYLDPAIVLYGAELGRYVRRFVGDRDAELHFIGKTLSFRPKAHAFPTVILEKLPLNPCVINPRKAITSANGF